MTVARFENPNKWFIGLLVFKKMASSISAGHLFTALMLVVT